MSWLRSTLLILTLLLLAVSAIRITTVALHEVAILLGCLLCLAGSRSHTAPRWLLIGTGLLLVGAVSSFLMAGAPADSLGKVVAFVALPIAAGWLILQIPCLRPVQIGLSLLLGVVTLYAFLQWLGIAPALPWQTGDASPQQYLNQGRIPGHTLSPNLLAMELVAAGFLLLGFLRRRALGWVVFALPVLWILFLTRSRASWIGAAAGAAYLVWHALRARPLWQRAWVGFCILATGAITYLVATSTDPSATSRAEIWSYTWILLQQSPLWGGSFSGYQEALAVLAQGNPSFLTHGLPYAVHPHHLLLATWWHTGILGLVGLVTVVAGSLWVRPTTWLTACAQASLVAVVANGMLDRTVWQADLAVLTAVAVAVTVRTRYAT